MTPAGGSAASPTARPGGVRGDRQSRGVRDIALAAMEPGMADTAEEALEEGFYADKTRASYSSAERLYLDAMSRRGFAPWPLRRETMRAFGAALQRGGYRSGGPYLAGVKAANKKRMNSLTKAEEEYAALVVRSLERDKGDDEFKEALGGGELRKLYEVANTTLRMEVYVLGLTCFHFVLRMDEASRLEQGRTHPGKDTVKIAISGSKTEQTGKLVDREQGCTCDVDKRLCPTHQLERHLKNLPAARRGKKELVFEVNYHEALEVLLEMLEDAGVPTEEDGRRKYGFHSFRRGGCQALARAKWPYEAIRTFARWGSDAILRYLREAPLEVSRHFAKSVVTALGTA